MALYECQGCHTLRTDDDRCYVCGDESFEELGEYACAGGHAPEYGYEDDDYYVEEEEEEDGYPCDVCGRVFDSVAALNGHRNAHAE